MPGYDDKTIEKNIAEHNEIYKSGVTPSRKDIRWTSAEGRQRDKDMKQFCKSSGEAGTDPYFVNSDAYREGWERIFGKRKDSAIAFNDFMKVVNKEPLEGVEFPPGHLLKAPLVFRIKPGSADQVVGADD